MLINFNLKFWWLDHAFHVNLFILIADSYQPRIFTQFLLFKRMMDETDIKLHDNDGKKIEGSSDQLGCEIIRATSTSTNGSNLTTCCACRSNNVLFTNSPCQCCAYCKKCAMKMATGGKCRVCGDYFSSMTTILKKWNKSWGKYFIILYLFL